MTKKGRFMARLGPPPVADSRLGGNSHQARLASCPLLPFNGNFRHGSVRDTIGVTTTRHPASVNTSQWFEFELSPAVIGIPVHLRLGDYEDRWTASVRCGSTTTDGLGATAREALVAALAPLGLHVTTLLMAQPVMFGASADLLARSELVPA